MKLRSYQQEGVDFLSTRRHSYLGDDMGLGKTIQAISVMNNSSMSKILIICPATVKPNWKRELGNWLHNKQMLIHVVSSGSDNMSNRANIIIVNYDLLLKDHILKQLKATHFDILICDEAHYLKNMKAERTKRVLGKAGVAWRAKHKIMLSGTPVLNKPVELYVVLKTLYPQAIGAYDTYEKFAYRYNGAYKDSMGYMRLGQPTNLRELHQKLSGFLIRRKIEDVEEELPAVTYQIIEFPMDDKIKKVIDHEHELQGADDGKGNGTFGNMAILRHETAWAKIDSCVKHIKNLMDEKEKVVIFAHHRDIIDELRNKLSGYGVRVLQGSMTPDQKQKSIDDFVERGDIRIFIGQVQAAGQGVDGLQKVANTIVFVESSWVPGEIKQAVGRLKRIGQKEDKLFAQFLVAEGTIDASMIMSVVYKDKAIQQLTEGHTEEEGALWANLV